MLCIVQFYNYYNQTELACVRILGMPCIPNARQTTNLIFSIRPRMLLGTQSLAQKWAWLPRNICDTKLLAAGTWASLGTTPWGKAFLEVLVSTRPGPEANTRPPARP